MATYKYWNGMKWEETKSAKAAYKALRERFNWYLENGCRDKARDMDGEQIHINTGDDEYSYAMAQINSMTHNGLIFIKI